MNSLVSIIIPVYNVERYLRRCLSSVIAQSYSRLEIILIDDGSTDSSGSICEQFRDSDQRITVIHKTNGGLSSARNAGLDIHRGEYIMFVDSDDFIHPDTVSDALGAALKEEADIVEFGIEYVHEGQDMNWIHYELSDYSIYEGESVLENILSYKFRIMAYGKLYRSFLFDGIRFPDGRIHEDEFTTPYIVERCRRYCRISGCYYAYLQRENSIMHTAFSPKRLDGLEAHEERFKYFSSRYHGRYDAQILYRYVSACMRLYLEVSRSPDSSQYVNAILAKGHKLLVSLLRQKGNLKLKLKGLLWVMLPRAVSKFYRP